MKSKSFLLIALVSSVVISFFIIRHMRKVNYPDLPKLTDVNGKAFDPTVLNDKLYIISYFQTWCSDCIKEKPQLEGLRDRYGKDNIEVLLISDEPVEKLAAYQEKFHTDLPIYHTEKALKKDLGVRAFPTTYLFGKKGQLLRKTVEGMNWDNEVVIKLLDNQLGIKAE